MQKNRDHAERKPHIVTIGGGTGMFAVLSGLKKYDVDITAIVSMADDGGSTGKLRDEFGVLPPGDLRQALVALSEGGQVMRQLFTHRFDRGELKGHSFGNIFISTLEQVTGDMDHALDVVGDILKIKGRVVPVTMNNVRLVGELKNGKILEGESMFMEYQLVSKFGIKRMYLTPNATANPKAIEAIRHADLIIVGPGKLYTSLLPNFLVEGITDAVRKSRATKVFINNLMSQLGHTDNFTVTDFVAEFEKFAKGKIFDVVVYNTKRPPQTLLRKYADEGEPVEPGTLDDHYEFLGANLLAEGVAKTPKVDLLRRTLIRHDPEKLAKVIMGLVATHGNNEA